MASLLVAYSETRTMEPPPAEYRPADAKFASLVGIEPITDDNLEAVLRLLLKQMVSRERP